MAEGNDSKRQGTGDLEHPRTIEWLGDRVRLIDQTCLPGRLVRKEITDYRELAESIRRLEVRGAPAIGVAGAMGLALAGLESEAGDFEELLRDVKEAAEHLAGTRPTAVNLRWAVDRVLRSATSEAGGDPEALRAALVDEALALTEEDRELSRSIGRHGAALLSDGDTVLTHCNAGGLATAEYGTALAVVYAAVEDGKTISVFADETRPLLQGARLTAWELGERGIDVTLLVDSAAASAMSRGWIDKVIVGADRIAANGDVANKIGTMPLALSARRFDVPFYVAAPFSTLDAGLASGSEIPIEERSPEEVTTFGGVCTAPEGVRVYNPAFDVTPAGLVSAIITDSGVFRPPYGETLFAGGRGGRA
ncbi:MAG: S-methyl-5-thioribose-1-phosphate isomerase [Candidatus Eisenbacteria bacterium]|nr:S-methyl-5-thioribose-1-phosphate isomerase [Candidatus Eisenbacteria bacterium]